MSSKPFNNGEPRKMKRYLLPALAASGLLTACWDPRGPGGWGSMMHDGMGYGSPYIGTIILVVVCLAVYFIVQVWNKKHGVGRENPLEILKRRFAKGEITGEEYEKIKKDLEG
jgi:putative membrane protein